MTARAIVSWSTVLRAKPRLMIIRISGLAFFYRLVSSHKSTIDLLHGQLLLFTT